MEPYILVVDDDSAILQGVLTILEQAGYQVRGAATGAEAESILANDTRPRLIILDLRLPILDGYEICRRARQITPYIPILMLSACDDLADKVAGLELGADDYMTKPFEPRELLARARAMLRFAEQRAANGSPEQVPLVAGFFKLCKSSHRAEVCGQPVDLAPKEWGLLELFIEHPGQVFGRETLLRRVWGCDFLGDSRTVDVHVQRLRAKLEAVPGAPRCLETVRGFGYRFVVNAANRETE
jgi:two-component system alkaline phosphatase synthesis response regulator PhoP